MFKKKIKTYSFDKYGLAQAKLDIKNERSNKINKVTNVGIMMLMLALGFMGKEFVIFYLINLGIGSVTDLFMN